MIGGSKARQLNVNVEALRSFADVSGRREGTLVSERVEELVYGMPDLVACVLEGVVVCWEGVVDEGRVVGWGLVHVKQAGHDYG